MREYDIIVVGAGPAGLQFAREIGTRSAYDIVVLERNDSLADNNKSTGGTFRQVIDGYGIPDSVIMDSTETLIFEGPSNSRKIPMRNYVLDFPRFLEFLGEDCQDNGVEIHTSTSVNRATITDGVVDGVEAYRNGVEKTYRGDVVVDASGPAGVCTKQLGMWNADQGQHALGKEYEVTGEFDCDSMVFKFDHEYAPGGYAWVFPAGENRFKIGVCWVSDFYEKHRAGETDHIDAYITKWINSDDRWVVNDIKEVHAGEAISDNSVNQRAGDGVVAIGDAVSSINPLLGEGIRPAMQSGEMAAKTVITALEAGSVSQETLSSYEEQWNKNNGRNWKTQRMVGELMYDFTARQQDTFVEKIGSLTDGQISRLQRYKLTLTDLAGLYPVDPRDIMKTPTLVRHLI